MAARSSWEGYLKLNLLSVPVKAFTATVSGGGKIAFHEIHKGCGSRVRHQKVCPIHGEITKDEVVSGYEIAKGQYVIFEPGELNELRKEDDKAITLDMFIPADALDPMYLSGRNYYLVPDGKVGQKPYAVLRRVMSEQSRHAIARIHISGRPQIAVIQPVGHLLVMSLLNYDEQIKKPSAFEDEAPDSALTKEEVKLAEALIDASSVEKVDLSEYHDDYAEEVAELIEVKSKGKKVVDRRTKEEPAVINLMDALRKSLNQTQKGEKKKHATVPKRRKTG